MFIELLCLIFAVACVFMFIKEKKIKGKVINGPKGLPIIGNILEIDNETIHQKFMEYADKFGEIFRLKLFLENVIVLNTQELFHLAYGDEKYKRSFGYRADMFYGRHFRSQNKTLAFISDGAGVFHRTARKIYVHALHTYGSGLHELENNVMTEMANLVQKIERKKNSEMECVGMLQRSLSNVMSLVLSGEMIPDDDPDVDMFWEHVEGNDFFLNSYNNFVMTTFSFLRFLPGKYGNRYRSTKRANRKIAKRYFYDLKKSFTPGQMRGIVDHYFEKQSQQTKSDADVFLTDEMIIAQIVETIDAGMTTSWSMLSNSMLVLLNYPQYQRKIQFELDEVIGRSRLPTYSDRDKCQFYQAFELEVHRYITVAPLSLPHVCKEHVGFEGYDVEANSTIIPNIWYLHHNNATWGDPWTFRPERFLDEEGKLLPREHILRKSLIPFGCGLRQCPGEMFAKTRSFLYLANLLQRWDFEFPTGKKRSCDPRKTENFDIKVIMRAHPFFFRAKERK